jgi:hypothetical protein
MSTQLKKVLRGAQRLSHGTGKMSGDLVRSGPGRAGQDKETAQDKSNTILTS